MRPPKLLTLPPTPPIPSTIDTALTQDACSALVDDVDLTSFYYSPETCASSASEWDWTRHGWYSDVESYCESESTMANYALSCCSDQLSVCEDYTAQLCQTEDNYTPLATYKMSCYGYSETEFDCPLSSTGWEDRDGDGTDEMFRCGGEVYAYGDESLVTQVSGRESVRSLEGSREACAPRSY